MKYFGGPIICKGRLKDFQSIARGLYMREFTIQWTLSFLFFFLHFFFALLSSLLLYTQCVHLSPFSIVPVSYSLFYRLILGRERERVKHIYKRTAREGCSIQIKSLLSFEEDFLFFSFFFFFIPYFFHFWLFSLPTAYSIVQLLLGRLYINCVFLPLPTFIRRPILSIGRLLLLLARDRRWI